MGPIGTNWPTMNRGEQSATVLRPAAKFRNGQGTKAREVKAREKLAAEIAALDADKARADLARANAKRKCAQDWVALPTKKVAPPPHFEIAKRK